MGIFDFFSGKEKEKERQEQLRLQQEQKRHAEEHSKAENSSQQLEVMQNGDIHEDKRAIFYKLENIKYIPLGGDFVLAPYDAQAYFSFPDASVLPIIANTEKIKRFLPGLGFDNEETTKKRLEGYMLKAENQLGLTYVIRSSNIPVGMIFINTPLYNEKTINLAIWTIDFYISEMLEHKGIMFNSLIRVLNEMKQTMEAKIVYAMIDYDNEDSKRLLGNGLFKQINNVGFKDSQNPQKAPLVYMIDLSTIRFERG